MTNGVHRCGRMSRRGGVVAMAVAAMLAATVAVFAQDNGFGASARFLAGGEGGGLRVAVTLIAPPDGVIPADSIALEAPGGGYDIVPEKLPAPMPAAYYPDGVYRNGATILYRVEPALPPPVLDFTLQGCTASVCHLPQTVVFGASPDAAGPSSPDAVGGDAGGALRLAEFTISRTSVGYSDAEAFCNWLSGIAAEDPADPLSRAYARYGGILTLLLAVGLGVLLNLTPCVLPMIPITLGVIGARSGSRAAGAFLGGMYGLGMALAFGGLGIGFLMVGGQFGALSANAWVNLAAGVVFVLLAAAMADLFSLDFSRFRGKVPAGGGRAGGAAAAFLLGVMAALLAGACVAPVLLWVLLLSVDLLQRGNAVAWLLPLALGAGLGLPWPILGGGVASLPRPGRWMIWVKRAFAILILLFGVYYIGLSIKMMRGNRPVAEAAAEAGGPAPLWSADIRQSLERSRQTGKAVLVDFLGLACKSCKAMDATTLRDRQVRALLDGYICLKVRGDDHRDADAQALMAHCRVIGFPTYVILQPPMPAAAQ